MNLKEKKLEKRFAALNDKALSLRKRHGYVPWNELLSLLSEFGELTGEMLAIREGAVSKAKQKKAVRALFSAGPAELGRAAVKAAIEGDGFTRSDAGTYRRNLNKQRPMFRKGLAAMRKADLGKKTLRELRRIKVRLS